MIENYLKYQNQKESLNLEGVLGVQDILVKKIYLDIDYFIKNYGASHRFIEATIGDVVASFYYAKINTSVFDEELHICEFKYLPPNIIYVEYEKSDESLMNIFNDMVVVFLNRVLAGEGFTEIRDDFLEHMNIALKEYRLDNLLKKSDHDSERSKI